MYWAWADADRLLVHSGGADPGAFFGETGTDGVSVEPGTVEPGDFRAPAVTRDGRFRAYVGPGDGTPAAVVGPIRIPSTCSAAPPSTSARRARSWPSSRRPRRAER